MPFSLIPFLLLAIPLLEIAVFILVGNLIGLWPTLALVVATAVAGVTLLRRQGFGALARIRRETAAGRLPGRELVDGVMILAAGLLLLTPGLVSDTVGLLLFVPRVREHIWRFLKRRVVVVGPGAAQGFRPGGGAPGRRPDVVDLSQDDFQRRPDPDSPWRGIGPEDEVPPNRTLY